MKNHREALKKKAKKLVVAQGRPEFLRPLRTLQQLGFLHNPDPEEARKFPGKLVFKEAMAAAKVEQRIAEVLPAVFIRRRKAFLFAENAPKELKAVEEAWKKKMPLPNFLGVSPEKYGVWIHHFQRKGSFERRTLKTFRFSDEDIALIERVRKKLKKEGAAETLRAALLEVDRRVSD